jgi:SPP1 gp7 family putative phage head morphogenesis protein
MLSDKLTELLNKLIVLQNSNTKYLKSKLKAILSEIDQELLPYKTAKISKQLIEEINEIKFRAEQLADDQSTEIHRSNLKRDALIAAAALSLISKIIASIYINESSIPDALNAVSPSIKAIAATETFAAFNNKFSANHKYNDGHYKWVAELDARTCNECMDNDGTIYSSYEKIPQLPAHVRCRCIMDFIND